MFGRQRTLVAKLISYRTVFVPVLALLLLASIGAGVGAFTFVYAKGFSYLSDDPGACDNCHVMNTVYESWMKGGHQHVAICNDCHVPHNFVGKWMTKALNGMHHSYAFTFEDVQVAIQARNMSKNVVQVNCARCHAEIARHAIADLGSKGEELQCVRCHREVGHAH